MAQRNTNATCFKVEAIAGGPPTSKAPLRPPLIKPKGNPSRGERLRHLARATSNSLAEKLLVVIAIIAILASLRLPVLRSAKDRSQLTVDVNNVKQVMLASVTYETDHNDYMPHPTGGTADGTAGAGADGWIYAVSNRGKAPSLPAYIPSAAGYDYNSVQYSNQIGFFKIGQLGQFLVNPQVVNCPKDVAQRHSGVYTEWWLARNVKIMSYVMNGTVGGYVPTDRGFNGKTYKATDFRPLDIILWEQNETRGFFFNDGGNNPLTDGEVISQRHAGTDRYTDSTVRGASGGGALVGRVGGTAQFIRMSQFLSMTKQSGPNDVLNRPGFRR